MKHSNNVIYVLRKYIWNEHDSISYIDAVYTKKRLKRHYVSISQSIYVNGRYTIKRKDSRD